MLQTSIVTDGFRSLAEGEAVEFTIEHGDDGRTKAVQVTGPAGAPPQVRATRFFRSAVVRGRLCTGIEQDRHSSGEKNASKSTLVQRCCVGQLVEKAGWWCLCSA